MPQVLNARRSARLRRLALAAALLLVPAQYRASVSAAPDPRPATRTLSIVGTSDLHGYFTTRDGRGGIGVFAGFVNNLRAARAADAGGVLLLDAGDTFQGGVESDLSEGAAVVDAYDALGYTALAIGNHEFDFGAADKPGARQDANADPQGAVKARAAQAHFPFLAANLLDARTGQLVDWPNVHPSMQTTTAGVRVGVVGVMTAGALRATLPLNVRGLQMAPLGAAVLREATALRASGATVVVVAAHAGGFCERFDNPLDLTSCDDTAEIFDMVRELPHGLVDAVVAGHTHAGLAHVVNGVPIVQSYWGGRAFGRIDLQVDAAGRVVSATPFAPQDICAQLDAASGACAASASAPHVVARYEGRDVHTDGRVLEAMEPALARVRALQAMPLGVVLEQALARAGDAESPLGNLFADALREEGRADIALNNNSIGGLRTDLPDGPLTFGRLYDAFPFDNRLVTLRMSVGAVEQGIANALRRGRRGAFGISGAHVRVGCAAGGLDVHLYEADGRRMDDTTMVFVAGMDSLFGGQPYSQIIGTGPLAVPSDAPVMREAVEDWLREQGRALRAAPYLAAANRRVEFDANTSACLAQ